MPALADLELSAAIIAEGASESVKAFADHCGKPVRIRPDVMTRLGPLTALIRTLSRYR